MGARCGECGFGSRLLLSPAGDRPTRDAHELRRATSMRATVRKGRVESVTSVGARHSS